MAVTKDELKAWLTEQITDICDNGFYTVESDISHPHSDDFAPLVLWDAYNEYIDNKELYENFEHCVKETTSFTVYAEDIFIEELYNRASDNPEMLDTLKESVNFGLLEECGFNGVDYDVKDFMDCEYVINLPIREEISDLSVTNFYLNENNELIDLGEDDAPDIQWKDNALTYILKEQGYMPADLFDRSIHSPMLDGIREALDGSYEDTVLSYTLSGKEVLDFMQCLANDERINIYTDCNLLLCDQHIPLDRDMVISRDKISGVMLEGTADKSREKSKDSYQLRDF